MRIYVSHARHGDFAAALYAPLLSDAALSEHSLILPHADPAVRVDALAIIPTCDLVFAEVSRPSTGQGIELGWAKAKGVRVVAVAEEQAQVSSSISAVSRHVSRYDSPAELVSVFRAVIAQHAKPYRPGVSALILNPADELLLVQKPGYAEHEWTVPGGGRESGETLEQNLARELLEELGVGMGAFEVLGCSTRRLQYDYPPDVSVRVNGGMYRGQSYDQAVLRYRGDPAELRFSDTEFCAHAWVPRTSLPRYLTFPQQHEDHSRALEEFLGRNG